MCYFGNVSEISGRSSCNTRSAAPTQVRHIGMHASRRQRGGIRREKKLVKFIAPAQRSSAFRGAHLRAHGQPAHGPPMGSRTLPSCPGVSFLLPAAPLCVCATMPHCVPRAVRTGAQVISNSNSDHLFSYPLDANEPLIMNHKLYYV